MPIAPISKEIIVNATPDAARPAVTGREDMVFVVWRHADEVFGQRLMVAAEPETPDELLEPSMTSRTLRKAGDELKLLAGEPGELALPAVARTASRGTFVAWLDRASPSSTSPPGAAGDTFEVRGQTFDEGGVKVGEDVLLGPAGPDDQHISIAFLMTGDLVVTWTGPHPLDPATGRAPNGRIIAADGSPVGEPFTALTTSATATDEPPAVQQLVPQVAARLGVRTVEGPERALPAPAFIVTWIDETAGTLRGQLFARDPVRGAQPSGVEFEIARDVAITRRTGITGLVDGRYAAAWIDAAPTFLGLNIVTLTLDGSRDDPVRPIGEGLCHAPTVEKLEAGGFVAAWVADDFGEENVGHDNVHAQALTSEGSPFGGSLRVNDDFSGVCDDPVVVALRGNRCVIAWTRMDSSGPSVRAKAFHVLP